MPTGIGDIKKKDANEVVSDPLVHENLRPLVYHKKAPQFTVKEAKAMGGIA